MPKPTKPSLERALYNALSPKNITGAHMPIERSAINIIDVLLEGLTDLTSNNDPFQAIAQVDHNDSGYLSASWISVYVLQALQQYASITDDHLRASWKESVLKPLLRRLTLANFEQFMPKTGEDSEARLIAEIFMCAPASFVVFLEVMFELDVLKNPSDVMRLLEVEDATRKGFHYLLSYQSADNIWCFLTKLKLQQPVNASLVERFKRIAIIDLSGSGSNAVTLMERMDHYATLFMRLLSEMQASTAETHEGRKNATVLFNELWRKIRHIDHQRLMVRQLLHRQMLTGQTDPAQWPEVLKNVVKAAPANSLTAIERNYLDYLKDPNRVQNPDYWQDEASDMEVNFLNPGFIEQLLLKGVGDFAHCQYLWNQLQAYGQNPQASKVMIVLRELVSSGCLSGVGPDNRQMALQALERAYPGFSQNESIMQSGTNQEILLANLAGMMLFHIKQRLRANIGLPLASAVSASTLKTFFGGGKINVEGRTVNVTDTTVLLWRIVQDCTDPASSAVGLSPVKSKHAERTIIDRTWSDIARIIQGGSNVAAGPAQQLSAAQRTAMDKLSKIRAILNLNTLQTGRSAEKQALYMELLDMLVANAAHIALSQVPVNTAGLSVG